MNSRAERERVSAIKRHILHIHSVLSVYSQRVHLDTSSLGEVTNYVSSMTVCLFAHLDVVNGSEAASGNEGDLECSCPLRVIGMQLASEVVTGCGRGVGYDSLP